MLHQHSDFEMRELSSDELEQVDGAGGLIVIGIIVAAAGVMVACYAAGYQRGADEAERDNAA